MKTSVEMRRFKSLKGAISFIEWLRLSPWHAYRACWFADGDEFVVSWREMD